MQNDVILEVRDGLAHMTLNRPDAMNAIGLQMAGALLDTVNRLSEAAGVRAVLLSGRGRMFCGGGDLKEFAAQNEQLPRRLKEITERLHVAVARLVRLEVPVVVAVHGSAAGAGLSLACSADYVVAGASAKFVPAYAKLGFSPDGSLSYFLPRLVGTRRAAELLLTGRILSAAEALEWGLANRVVADDAVLAEGEAQARMFAEGPTLAYGAVKRLLRSSWTASLETQMEDETQELASAGASADGQEGVTAFLEKRAAVFKGQ